MVKVAYVFPSGFQSNSLVGRIELDLSLGGELLEPGHHVEVGRAVGGHVLVGAQQGQRHVARLVHVRAHEGVHAQVVQVEDVLTARREVTEGRVSDWVDLWELDEV